MHADTQEQPKADLSRIERFLQEYGVRPDLSALAVDLIAPFFRRVQQGGYTLAPIEEINPEECARALSELIGRQVEVTVHSLSAFFAATDGESPEDAETRFQKLADDLLERVETCEPPEDLEQAIELRLTDMLGGRCSDAFDEAIDEELDFMDLLPGVPEEFAAALLSEVAELVTTVTAMAAVGDEPTVKRIAPTLKMLYKALPLGERSDAPGSWILFAA